MGYQELIESLREKARSRIEALQREAEEEVKKYRERAFSEFEAFMEEYLNSVRRTAESEISSILLEAKKEAGIIKTLAMQRLSERLYRSAVEGLSILRSKGYEEVFRRLVDELPSLRWSRLKVAPSDRGMAEKYFPEVDIEVDKEITGGIIAETEDGITINNTLEKRLERLWPELLPEILKEIMIEE
ncbi:MAG: V-type ATP synthase subunit E [Thermodesulfovibrionales bacterium]